MLFRFSCAGECSLKMIVSVTFGLEDEGVVWEGDNLWVSPHHRVRIFEFPPRHNCWVKILGSHRVILAVI